MKIFQLAVLAIVLFFSCLSNSAQRTWFDEPIKTDQAYVNDIEVVILESLEQRGWEVKSKTPSKVTAWLNDYKGYELVLEIIYNNSQIEFNQLSFTKVNCIPEDSLDCQAEESYSNRWRLYLRKNIAMNIHKRAMDHLLKNKKIHDAWMVKLKTGNSKYKTTLARNLIDIEYYNENVMDEMAIQIKRSYKLRLNKKGIQQYAFYCKLLARSKLQKYKALLTEVRDNANKSQLRRYVRGYLKEASKS